MSEQPTYPVVEGYDDCTKSPISPPKNLLDDLPARWLSPRRAHIDPNSSQSLTHTINPKILIHVFSYLHSTRDIHNALFVSRAWCECAVGFLWYKPELTKLSTLIKLVRVLDGEGQTFAYVELIKRLNLRGDTINTELTDSLLIRLKDCVQLDRLTLTNCINITDAGLCQILPSFFNLVSLDIEGVLQVTDKAVIALASSAQGLQGINLTRCKDITDESILILAANCPLLRRVRLGYTEVTDEAVFMLAKSCPHLLEINLGHCDNITDASVQDIWTFSTNMREITLSHCRQLTDLAFPAPVSNEINANESNISPSLISPPDDSLPSPIMAHKTLNGMRVLDLEGCSQLTDDAIAGIVAVAPQIRNLVLSHCSHLTDQAVESICKLGSHLHYLHLGNSGYVTDESIRLLAHSCTRLRYIDLANCHWLTDESICELASLPKLRRIGLVRVNGLTDRSIHALAEQHAPLERVHLSYCGKITIPAIYHLLEKAPKLTHLSLTGVPAFCKPELQSLSRECPPEFTTRQRSTFCVYSGSGIMRLREYLAETFVYGVGDLQIDSTTDDTSE